MLAATLSLAALVLCPQGDATPQHPVTLKKGALNKLQKRLSDMLEERARLDGMQLGDPGRESARERLGKAREAFRAEWDKHNKDGNLLGSIGDLRAIYRSAYPYEKERGRGRMGDEQVGSFEFGLMVPRKYDRDEPTPLMLAVPGKDDGEWREPDDHYDATWDDSAFAKTGLVVVPKIPGSIDLDPMPDFTDPAGEAVEKNRLKLSFACLYHVMNKYRVDRDRVFLDCGKGASAYGLRMATYAPRYFAGVILRDPQDIEGMRLGSLLGIKVLLIKSTDTAAGADKLKERLDAVDLGIATVLEVEGSAPFSEQKDAIDGWVAGVRRDLYQSKVIVEPNYDTFKDAAWAYISVAQPIGSLPEGKKPRLEVVADREANRITVQAQGVESFYLMLNDAIVNLDEEFTVEINGVATTQKYQRSLNNMIKWSAEQKPASDPTYLFPARFAATVPKVEEDENGSSNGGGD